MNQNKERSLPLLLGIVVLAGALVLGVIALSPTVKGSKPGESTTDSAVTTVLPEDSGVQTTEDPASSLQPDQVEPAHPHTNGIYHYRTIGADTVFYIDLHTAFFTHMSMLDGARCVVRTNINIPAVHQAYQYVRTSSTGVLWQACEETIVADTVFYTSLPFCCKCFSDGNSENAYLSFLKITNCENPDDILKVYAASGNDLSRLGLFEVIAVG